MSVLTLKVTPSLIQRLTKAAGERSQSRSSFVREAVEAYLAENKSDIKDRITKATRRIIKGSFTKRELDWTDIYAQARVDTGMTPDEEVRRSRTRGLDLL